MSERIIVVIDEHVATVTLNRADKRNAVDMAMFEALFAAAAAIDADTSVRAVVLHGSGADFCAGIDIATFADLGATATADLMRPRTASGANFFQNAAMCWRDLRVPVIAALHGSVFGAGLQIALGADIRYASPDCRLSIMEVKWGLIPDMAITATMPGVVAGDKVREMSYTGRVVRADEAASSSLVTRVCDDPFAKATELARDIASKSPDAVQAMKKLFNESDHRDGAKSLRREAELQTMVMATPNQKEAVMANLEKRTPRFDDPKP